MLDRSRTSVGGAESRSPNGLPDVSRARCANIALVKSWREHDWDDALDYGLELVEGIYALLAVALFGVLVGFGAAVLLDIPRWLGVVTGGFLMPVLMLLLIWAVRREDERS